MVKIDFSGFLRKIIIMPKWGKWSILEPKIKCSNSSLNKVFFENVPDDRHWVVKYDFGYAFG